jgi:serine/threonine protein kinase
MPLRIGETFAGYRILRLLGSGGMGEVYLVQHPRLPRQDALKVLRSDVSSDASFRERFVREADLAAGLRHSNIVGIHDRGDHNGQLWIAMDYIEGTDAAQFMEQRYPAGMPTDLVVQIVTAVASALDYAHKKGLLHRDVKPANMIVADIDTDDPSVFLADFGIARPLNDTSGITTTNITVGLRCSRPACAVVCADPCADATRLGTDGAEVCARAGADGTGVWAIDGCTACLRAVALTPLFAPCAGRCAGAICAPTARARRTGLSPSATSIRVLTPIAVSMIAGNSHAHTGGHDDQGG